MKRRDFILQTSIGAGTMWFPAPLSAHRNNDINKPIKKEYPFLWGTAYYRAPEPEPSLWEGDFKKMHEMGFRDVKYLVQWRWSHIRESEYYFDDTLKLLDLAAKYSLKVTLNFLFDVSPHWLFDKHPDAKPVLNNGRVVEPYVVGHRAIGGHPGPCYNHEGARLERKKFLSEAIRVFKNHPAMDTWDVWNEPELCFPQRSPIQIEKLACYCMHCRDRFREYLKNKYGKLSVLNTKWGRNYLAWNQVEMPRSGDAFLDFIDWREFHGSTLTAEAAWRINMVRQQDPKHTAFLHVVPNTMNPFNAVTTCVDDFKMAELCDVFGATTIGPLFTTQLMSAGKDKVCYNVECHINGGTTSTHQKPITLEILLRDFIPQLGLGVKGFMFWQFRPEVLGKEAPAWGVVNLDGSDREVTTACRSFWNIIKPHTQDLMATNPPIQPIGIWKSRKNEIFQYCMHNSLDPIIENINGYVDTLYWNNYPFRYISGDDISMKDLEHCKLLILPSAYFLTEPEASTLAQWVDQGGVLIAEAHTGGYNGTSGRHSRVLPGCGLHEAFGIKETLTTSSFHLNMEKAEVFKEEVSGDAKKALGSIGITGSRYFPIYQENKNIIWGDRRYAELSGEGIRREGYFEKDKPCAISKSLGKGYLYYYGTQLGSGSVKSNDGLLRLIERACQKAGVRPILNASSEIRNKFRADVLQKDGTVKFIALRNMSKHELKISLSGTGNYKALFTGKVFSLNNKTQLTLSPEFTDLLVRQD